MPKDRMDEIDIAIAELYKRVEDLETILRRLREEVRNLKAGYMLPKETGGKDVAQR
jgi:predicted ATP-grasp superfamily ATP-dependent carboligase